MNKKHMSIGATLFGILFESVRADLVGPSPVLIGGVALVFIGIVVGTIGLTAWFIIRAIKKKSSPPATPTQKVEPVSKEKK